MVGPFDTPNYIRKALPPSPLEPVLPSRAPFLRPCKQWQSSCPLLTTPIIHVANHECQADPRLLAALDLMRRMPPSRMESSLEGPLLHHNQHIYREQHTCCGPTRALHRHS
jgi:hypothetical protein